MIVWYAPDFRILHCSLLHFYTSTLLPSKGLQHQQHQMRQSPPRRLLQLRTAATRHTLSDLTNQRPSSPDAPFACLHSSQSSPIVPRLSVSGSGKDQQWKDGKMEDSWQSSWHFLAFPVIPFTTSSPFMDDGGEWHRLELHVQILSLSSLFIPNT